MKQEIKLRYFNAELNIGLVSWREAYVLLPSIQQMNLETYKGRIIYRLKGSAKRISYNRLKKGLVKTNKTIEIEVPNWLFDVPLQRPPKKQKALKVKAGKASKIYL
jgi:hypothetical protein